MIFCLLQQCNRARLSARKTDDGPPANSFSLTSTPVLKRFKHLSAKMESASTSSTGIGCQPGCETPQSQICKYISEMQEKQQPQDALAYWLEHRPTYYCLVDIALDFVSAPASQAYVERVFSVCGMLTQGRRNRMSKSLEMRARLKLNAKLLQEN